MKRTTLSNFFELLSIKMIIFRHLEFLRLHRPSLQMTPILPLLRWSLSLSTLHFHFSMVVKINTDLIQIKWLSVYHFNLESDLTFTVSFIISWMVKVLPLLGVKLKDINRLTWFKCQGSLHFSSTSKTSLNQILFKSQGRIFWIKLMSGKFGI